MDTSAYSNTRRYRRRPCDRRVMISFREHDLQNLMHGHCVSVSEGGVGAVIDGHLDPGRKVSIEFGGGGPVSGLRLDAHVRYHQGFQHGFEFVDSDKLGPQQVFQICGQPLAWN